MTNSIDTIFNPASIAIVGATNRPQSVGQAVVRNLIQGEFQGVLYPVHPTLKSIFGVKAYKCLEDIPDPVDLVVIIIKPEMVPAVIEDAARKGISSAVVDHRGLQGSRRARGRSGKAHPGTGRPPPHPPGGP
jgi:acyl-CoA synthetase (NDP forming)